MGGYGSGRSAEYCTTSEYSSIKVSPCYRHQLFTQGSSSFTPLAPAKAGPIALTWTACHYGGLRPWFVCGRCTRRVGVLYWSSRRSAYACRVCLQLTYESQREDRISRAFSKKHRYLKRLDAPAEWDVTETPQRPKGMWWRTYERLRMKAREADLQGLWRMAARFAS